MAEAICAVWSLLALEQPFPGSVGTWWHCPTTGHRHACSENVQVLILSEAPWESAQSKQADGFGACSAADPGQETQGGSRKLSQGERLQEAYTPRGGRK